MFHSHWKLARHRHVHISDDHYKWGDWDKKFTIAARLAKHAYVHIIDEHMCNLCGITSKNKFYGKHHIKYKHPKEFGVTKDFLDLLTKKEKTVAKM